MISSPPEETITRHREKLAAYSSLREYFEEAVAETPDRPFVECGEEGRTVTYGAANDRANAVANELSRRGIGKSDRVTVMLPNGDEFVYTVLGAQKLGAVPALVNVELRGPGLVHSLGKADSDVLVTTDELYADHGDVFERQDFATTSIVERSGADLDLDYVPFAGLVEDGATADPDPVEIFEDDGAAIPFSSGTTGHPKGMLMPQRNYLLWGEFFEDMGRIPPGGGYHNCLPLYHQAGLWSLYYAIAVNGYFTVFDSFSLTSFWDRVDRFDCRGTTLVSEMATWLWNEPEAADDADHALEWAFVFGGPKQHREDFEDRFDLEYHNGYGMTETHAITWSESPREGERKPESEGRPLFSDVTVVDDHDRELEPGEVGEVVVRPRLDNIVLKEYVDDYEVTAAKLRNCWYHTGDLARLDEEGFLYYEGKLAEYLRRKGENVSHAEVETVVDAFDGVEESAVIGVPDPEVGEEVKIHVLLESPVDRPEAFFEALLEYCEENLPAYQVPRYFEVLDSFPRTEATMRVQKHRLEDRGRDGLTATTWDRTTRDYCEAGE